MSPNNYTSDTAKFFEDLNSQSINLATAKRSINNKQPERSGQKKNNLNNFNILRGSIGGKLSKLRIKTDSVNKYSIRKSAQIQKK